MKKILIIAGDPYSINSEIIFKVWKKISNKLKKNIFVIGSANLLERQFKKLSYNIQLKKIEDINEEINSNKLKIIDINLNFNNPFKIKIRESKKYIKQSLNVAHNIINHNKNIGGLINCPINKDLLANNGLGVTEYLAAKCRIKKNSEVMLIRNHSHSVERCCKKIKQGSYCN